MLGHTAGAPEVEAVDVDFEEASRDSVGSYTKIAGCGVMDKEGCSIRCWCQARDWTGQMEAGILWCF